MDIKGRAVIQRLISSVPLGGEDKFTCLHCNAICQKLSRDSLVFCKSTRAADFTSGTQMQNTNAKRESIKPFYNSGIFLLSDAVTSDIFL